MAVPTSTYRLQLTPEFGFREAAAVVSYLAALGVSHVYLSPVLEAVAGSMHGYDVVDHGRLSEERGGREGWDVLQAALRRYGLGCVVDVVPNHMAVPAPERLNAAFWSVLRSGRESPYAHWFDVDWQAGDGKLVLPILGGSLDAALDAGELVRDGDVLRYFEHELPAASGHYRLCGWREGAAELNYRRFFDVTSLAGVRVEDEDVFAATHRLVLDLVAAGDVQGLRVDHPDGLADPRGYLRRLRAAAPDTWLVAEKILAPGEVLPDDWPCDGTTGYDTLRAVGGVLLDPAGVEALSAAYRSAASVEGSYAEVAERSRRDVWRDVLVPERARLDRVLARCLPDEDPATLDAALTELVVAMPVYRSYVVPGEPPGAAAVEVLDEALAAATARVPGLGTVLGRVRDLAAGGVGGADAEDFVVRFQQTCAALAAKGVEDTAFYRWVALASLSEVGDDPGEPGVPVEELHRYAAALPESGMTALSTHDTKRGEDVRARLAVLSELPDEWLAAVRRWHARARRHGDVGDRTGWLLWQTLVGAWPISADRLVSYLRKGCREAKLETSWLDPDEAYEERVREYALAVLADEELRAEVAAFVARVAPYGTVNSLAQKLVQLTLPGVPDCYQGAEVLHLALVDPDNRGPVDYASLAALIAAVADDAALPAWADEPDAAKLLVTTRALRLRRDRPDLFDRYLPLFATGPAAGHVLAYSRGGAVTVVPRLPLGLERAGGCRDTTVELPDGAWTDAFTGGTHWGTVRLADLLAAFPVALLIQ